MGLTKYFSLKRDIEQIQVVNEVDSEGRRTHPLATARTMKADDDPDSE